MTQQASPKKRQHTLTLIAGVTVAIGSCLPWVSIFGISVSGLEGDGVLTLILAIIGLVLFGLSCRSFNRRPKFRPKVGQVGGIVVSALSLLIGLNAMNGFAAIGLYLTVLGSGAWLAFAIWDLKTTHESEQAAGPSSGS